MYSNFLNGTDLNTTSKLGFLASAFLFTKAPAASPAPGKPDTIHRVNSLNPTPAIDPIESKNPVEAPKACPVVPVSGVS